MMGAGRATATFERAAVMQKRDVLHLIEQRLDATLAPARPVAVLEAGGGSCSHVRLGRPLHVTTLDISPEQLARNRYASEKILGDLEAWEPPARYDLIVCWNVLEHLERPHLALKNMVSGLSDGGMLLIGCPNLYSLKGLVTKITPHRAHIWYYRIAKGADKAGQPGYAPFQTFLRKGATPRAIRGFAREQGLRVEIDEFYFGPEMEFIRRKYPFLHLACTAVTALVWAATFGALDASASDWVVLLRKPAVEARTP